MTDGDAPISGDFIKFVLLDGRVEMVLLRVYSVCCFFLSMVGGWTIFTCILNYGLFGGDEIYILYV